MSMEGIKVSLQHASHYEMSSSSEDDDDNFSNLSSDDMAEVEDVIEDVTIGYPELANASGRRRFIRQLSSAGLAGIQNEIEASGSDYFAEEIGFNYDNSEQLLLHNPLTGDELFASMEGIIEEALLGGSERLEADSPSSSLSFVSKEIFQADLNEFLEMSKPDSDDALQSSEQVSSSQPTCLGLLEQLTDELLKSNTPVKLASKKEEPQSAQEFPQFSVVKRDPAVVPSAPAAESVSGAQTTACLSVQTAAQQLERLNALLAVTQASPSASSEDASSSPGVHQSASPNDSLIAPPGTSGARVSQESVAEVLQHSPVKKASPEDSYNETSTTDLSRESSLSSACRLPLAGRRRGRKSDVDSDKSHGKDIKRSKGKGQKKKKAAQTRRDHNSRAFKNIAEPRSSERESSSDELDKQEWISNRPITRHFFNNLDEFCNRASRCRKPKSRGKQRKNSKPIVAKAVPPAAAAVAQHDQTPAGVAVDERPSEAAARPEVQALSLAFGDSNVPLEPHTDDLLEEDLMGMFPSNLSQVIEEAGLNISDLNFTTSAAFDDIRCDDSVMDAVDVNFMPFPAPGITVDHRLVLPAAAVLPNNTCEGAVVALQDNPSTPSPQALSSPEVLASPNVAGVDCEPSALSPAGPSLVSGPVSNGAGVRLAETSPHDALKPKPSSAGEDEAITSLPELPGIRPGSVVLAVMDSSGNLVPVSKTCITMQDVHSVVPDELRASLTTEGKRSLDVAAEQSCKVASKTCDVKPDVSFLRSSAKDSECSLFPEWERKPKTEKISWTSAPTSGALEEIISVKEEPPEVQVKREAFPATCDASEPVLTSCKTESPSMMSPKSPSSEENSDCASQPAISNSLIRGQDKSRAPPSVGPAKPPAAPAAGLSAPAVDDKAGVALLASGNEQVICKIPDYLQPIFKEQKSETKCAERLRKQASSEAETSEAGATDAEDRSGPATTGSDSSEPSRSQAEKKKIKVSEYFKRKRCVSDGPKRILRSAAQVKHEGEKAPPKSKSPLRALKRPEMTNIKSMLSDSVPQYSSTEVSQDSPAHQVATEEMTKSVRPEETKCKAGTSKIVFTKAASKSDPEPRPEVLSEAPKSLPREGAQNVFLSQPKDTRDTFAKVSYFKMLKKNEACIVKDSSTTTSENAGKLSVATRLPLSAPCHAKSDVLNRLVPKKEPASSEPRPSQPKVVPEVPLSPRSRSSSRGLKRGRSSSVMSTSNTSDSNDSRKSRRRHRHRSTSPSLSPIPLFRKKRNKKSHKRHKSRKRHRESSSSSSRSRSPSYSSRRRRHRRKSFSPATSRSRSRSSDSYSRKRRSGKRSRYSSRSRSRSFSPNTVYSVGCACGGGDPRFVGHLPSCRHYTPCARYPTPEVPSQQPYHHPHHAPAPYQYRPYYYDYSCPQDQAGAYMHSRRGEADAFVYGRNGRPNSLAEQNLRAKQVEERLVVYVGRIPEGTTKDGLRERFKKYGSITDISLHFRERGDNYGFVTFTNSTEANRAIENGNKGHELQFDLCFGGRRQFCRQQYQDLDALPAEDEISRPSTDFDSLLREMMFRR